MRQVYATVIQCNLCGTTATVPEPPINEPSVNPDRWLGPVWLSTDYRGTTPHDFCPGCAGMPMRDLMARLKELEQERAHG